MAASVSVLEAEIVAVTQKAAALQQWNARLTQQLEDKDKELQAASVRSRRTDGTRPSRPGSVPCVALPRPRHNRSPAPPLALALPSPTRRRLCRPVLPRAAQSAAELLRAEIVSQSSARETLAQHAGALEARVAELGDIVLSQGRDLDGSLQVLDSARDGSEAEHERAAAAIQKVLVDQAVPLFERYKAMFSLRNCGSRGAVLALCTGLRDPSPLFRHEVAYVLGQLSHAAATEALKLRVADADEHIMVRHEAAEALGAIGTPEATQFLEGFAGEGGGDEAGRMLRESVAVALDAADYFSSTADAAEEAKAL